MAIPNLQTRIYRKHYKDVVSNHMDGPTSFPELLRQWSDDKLVKITENEVQFKNGSLIQLAGMLHKKDLEKHQGNEKHLMWIDEATQILPDYIKGLRAWVRMPLEMKVKLPDYLRGLYPELTDQELMELFPRVLYTCNPIGVSVGYFRRGFIDQWDPLQLHQASEEDGGFLRCFIPSRIEDNPSADPLAQKRRLAPLGKATAEALILGLWGSVGGDFYPEYDDDVHAVEDFTPPNHWFKFRTFDWGSSDPFAVYWWAVSDGEGFLDDEGRERWFPRGALVAYREWYGCNLEDPAKGVYMRNEEIAKGIVQRTRETTTGLTFSDNFPFADRGHSKNHQKFTMADDFREHGCPLMLGNTARVYGWKQLRSRLQGEEGVPMIYLVKSCVYARQYLPMLPYNDGNREDAAESGEATHSCDAIRLACTTKPIVKEAPIEKSRDLSSSKRSPTAASLMNLLNQQKANPYVRRR